MGGSKYSHLRSIMKVLDLFSLQGHHILIATMPRSLKKRGSFLVANMKSRNGLKDSAYWHISNLIP